MVRSCPECHLIRLCQPWDLVAQCTVSLRPVRVLLSSRKACFGWQHIGQQASTLEEHTLALDSISGRQLPSGWSAGQLFKIV